ncbi:MAG: tRNA lysidine(34) synthetase TilS [Clostridiales bacterium]|nr:tRNA lysidine(34) synthetase TilS [Clostridiales bacterium]
MIERVLEYIRKHNMLEPGHKVVVGVSGGADSLALIHILGRIKKYIPLTLFVAHVNHGLRGEAAREDADFVEAMAKEWGYKFFLKEAKVSKLAKEWGVSEEEAGRKVRYDFFKEVLDEVGGHRIALAHHRDDQAETILHNIIRGTGLAGLSGIKPVRDEIFIRPLLEISRKEIEDYCHQNGLKYRIDHTNEEIIYTRNRIRHMVIPMIEEHFNPNFSSSLVRMGDILREEEDFLANYTNKVFGKIAKHKNNEVKISLLDFIMCHKAIQARVIRHGLEFLKKDLVGIEQVHIEGVLNLALNSNVGSILNLPNDIMARKDYDYLVLSLGKTTKGKDFVPVPDFLYELPIPGKVLIPELGVEISAQLEEKSTVLNKGNKCIYIDAEAVQGDKLYVRNRRNGDRFKPLGMKGTKKLKDFFIDNKISRYKRDSIPLVVDRYNIIWVVGHQISQDYRVTKDTNRLLKLEIKEKD